MKAVLVCRICFSLFCMAAGLATLMVCPRPLASAIERTSLRQEATIVPFVGCKSDGQLGPEDAPTGKSVRVPIATEVAQHLAYYKSKRSLPVLAPRGWHCFGTYGSSGTTLYVSPQVIDRSQVFSTSWSGFTGPAVEVDPLHGLRCATHSCLVATHSHVRHLSYLCIRSARTSRRSRNCFGLCSCRFSVSCDDTGNLFAFEDCSHKYVAGMRP